MSLQLAVWLVLALLHIIDVDEVVVRAHSKFCAIGAVAHDLDPLLRMIHLADDIVKLVGALPIWALTKFKFADGNIPVIVADGQMLKRGQVSQCTCLAMGRLLAHGGGSTSFLLRWKLLQVIDDGDASFSNASLTLRVVHKNSVVVAAREVVTLAIDLLDGHAPRLSIIMRPYLSLVLGDLWV